MLVYYISHLSDNGVFGGECEVERLELRLALVLALRRRRAAAPPRSPTAWGLRRAGNRRVETQELGRRQYRCLECQSLNYSLNIRSLGP
jgi:hypothetical protein